MVDIRQDASGGMIAVDRNQGRLAQSAEGLRAAPEFDLGYDVRLFAQFQQFSIAAANGQKVRIGLFRGTKGRSGDPVSSDLPDECHRAFRFFEPLFATVFIIDDPLKKADHAGDRQAGVLDPLFQVGEYAAFLDELVEVANPGFDGRIAGLGGDIDFFDNGQFLAVDRAGIQTKLKRSAHETSNFQGARIGRLSHLLLSASANCSLAGSHWSFFPVRKAMTPRWQTVTER